MVGATTDKAQYGFPYGVPYYLVNFLALQTVGNCGINQGFGLA
jgi:hypothetical protein